MSIKSAFKKLCRLLFTERVIMRGQRVIFMTTLYLKIGQLTSTSVTLEDCNQQLGLVDNVDALKLPAALGDRVWVNDKSSAFNTIASAICGGDKNAVTQAVMSITPAWLNYDAGSCLMRNDIDTVVGCISRKHTAFG